MSDTTLYGITQELQALDELLDMEGGEITPEIEALENEIKNLVVSKTDGCIGYLRKDEDWIKSAKQLVKEMQASIKSRENKVERFKGYIMDCLESVEGQELSGTMHKLKFRKPAKVVVIDDFEKIPPKFQTIIPAQITVNKNELKAALKAGEEVKGARLEDGNRSLNIGIGKA